MSVPNVLTRLPKGGDLLQEINALCKEKNIRRGAVQVMGAVEKATLGYYLQDERRYISQEFDEHMEILAGIGNVSIKDGDPFVHLHLTLSRKDYSVIGGHTMPGCVIFAAEVCIITLEGEELVRGFDEPTGLPLWSQK